MATTQEEKLEKAKQKLAKAQKQIALINDKRKKADDRAKILLGVLLSMLAKESNLQPGFWEKQADEKLKPSDAEIVKNYLGKIIKK